MTVPVPSAGDAGVATWAAAVANQLNTMVSLTVAADVATNSTSYSDVATCAVESGKVYAGELYLRWTPNSTGQGAIFAINGPSGTLLAYASYHNGADGSTATTDRQSSTDSGTGVTTADNTNGRITIIRFWFSCTASGTLAVRLKRGGSSSAPGITVYKGGGGIVAVQA